MIYTHVLVLVIQGAGATYGDEEQTETYDLTGFEHAATRLPPAQRDGDARDDVREQ